MSDANNELQEMTPARRRAITLHNTTLSRVKNYSAAARFWHERLNPVDRARLGKDLDDAFDRHFNAVRMWQHLHPMSDVRAVVEVGRKLGFLEADDAEFVLREAGELPRDAELAKDQAIQRGDLVLDDQAKTMYWRGTEWEVEWTRGSWHFFLVACRHAKRREPIDRLSFGENARENIVTQEKSRLKSLRGFPSELIDFFKAAGTGTQRFTFPPENIFIAEA